MCGQKGVMTSLMMSHFLLKGGSQYHSLSHQLPNQTSVVENHMPLGWGGVGLNSGEGLP